MPSLLYNSLRVATARMARLVGGGGAWLYSAKWMLLGAKFYASGVRLWLGKGVLEYWGDGMISKGFLV